MASQNAAVAQELLARQQAGAVMPPAPALVPAPAPGAMPVADAYAAGNGSAPPPELTQAQFVADLNKEAQAAEAQKAAEHKVPFEIQSKVNGSPALTPEETEARDKAAFAASLPPGMIMSPEQLAIAQARTQHQGLLNNANDESSAIRLAREQEKNTVAEAEAAKPILDDMVRANQASYDRQKTAHEAIQKELDVRMAHYASVQTELQKMAEEKPQDLFGAAGVNRILGSIAIFFGGAGSNGFGPNENLARIQNMADRNIQAQKNRYEMLSRVGQGDQTMYGMLVQKMGSTDAAEAAMRNAYSTLAESKVKAFASEFAKPRAKIDADKFLMQAQAERNQRDMAVRQGYEGQAMQGLQLTAQAEALRAAESHRLHKDMVDEAKLNLEATKYADERADTDRETSLAGFVGHVPKAEHQRLAKYAGGARILIDNLDQMRKMVSSHMSPAQIRAFSTAVAINTAGARQFFETGQRLEEGENKQIATVALSQLDNFFFQLQNATSGTDVAALLDKIEDTQALITRAVSMAVSTAAPDIKFDANDKTWGRFNPSVYEPAWAKDAVERSGTPEGVQELSSMPDFGSSEKPATSKRNSPESLNPSNQEAAAAALRKRYGR